MNNQGIHLQAGGDDGRVQGIMQHLDQCRKACINLDDCVGFVFMKREKNKDNCRVKKSWERPGIGNANCCDSGRITNICRQKYKKSKFLLLSNKVVTQ